jgi:hypothetical protein
VHWVTKVFTVGAAVLSVLLAALVMTYSVNVKAIRDDHANQVAARLEAEATKNSQLAAAADERNRNALDKQAASAERQSILDQIAQLQRENSTLRTEKMQAEAARDTVTNKIQELGATTKTLTTLVENFRAEVNALRDNEMRARVKEIQLLDRNNDLVAQLDVLTQQSRALGEQVAELRRQQEGAKVAGDGEGRPMPVSAFTGRVTEVKRDATTGEWHAQINLGSNDGVRDQMELSLARGSQFLGKLIVIRTDLQWAVGRVDTLGVTDPQTGKPVQIQPEDEVYSVVR